MDRKKLKMYYARLNGIKQILEAQTSVDKFIGDDYNTIIDKISKIINEDLTSFFLPEDFFYSIGPEDYICRPGVIEGKMAQILPYLETGHNLSEPKIELKAIFDSILDNELVERCADLLSAEGNFDRVINQSTQVLEDRIRNKAGLDKSITGVNLVNKALNSDLKKTILLTSEDPNEHEGICHICRGLMLGFRNQTHHQLTNKFSREEALKLCAFIDNILLIIDNAKKNSPE